LKIHFTKSYFLILGCDPVWKNWIGLTFGRRGSG